MSKFNQMRRQQFMNERYYEIASQVIRDSIALWSNTLPAEGQNDLHKRALAASDVAENRYELFSLRYTAGESLLELRDELETVIAAYERYTQRKREFENDPQHPPFYFAELLHYERLMQLIGLCYLLHRRDLLPEIAAMEDPNYFGHDTLYEELLDYELPDRYDTNKIFHKKPYELLIHAMYADSDDESIQKVIEYVKTWYPAMESLPWHGSHTRMTPEGSEYFGYWAFEAGAIAYLLDLDDSTIDHMVYPRHAVEFARSFEKNKEEFIQRGRCEALHRCPRAGYWYTPAKQNSRRKFNSGETMPDFPGSSWGATIWYWDTNQDE